MNTSINFESLTEMAQPFGGGGKISRKEKKIDIQINGQFKNIIIFQHNYKNYQDAERSDPKTMNRYTLPWCENCEIDVLRKIIFLYAQ